MEVVNPTYVSHTLTYTEVADKVFCEGTAPNGYFGERTHVRFAWDQASKATFVVVHCGYFNSGIPLALTQEESLWLLKFHPTARRKFRVTKVL